MVAFDVQVTERLLIFVIKCNMNNNRSNSVVDNSIALKTCLWG